MLYYVCKKIRVTPMKGIDTMKKMTKKEMFAQIKTHLTNAEEIAFIEHEIELLENKASGTRKPTSTQVENEKLKGAIVEHLASVNEPLTIVDIQKGLGLEEVSNQKMSALLKQLVDNGTVVKTYEKRKAYFSIGE